jgi:hypothetical protein
VATPTDTGNMNAYFVQYIHPSINCSEDPAAAAAATVAYVAR